MHPLHWLDDVEEPSRAVLGPATHFRRACRSSPVVVLGQRTEQTVHSAPSKYPPINSNSYQQCGTKPVISNFAVKFVAASLCRAPANILIRYSIMYIMQIDTPPHGHSSSPRPCPPLECLAAAPSKLDGIRQRQNAKIRSHMPRNSKIKSSEMPPDPRRFPGLVTLQHKTIARAPSFPLLNDLAEIYGWYSSCPH